MAGCFGAVIHDRKLVKTGIISELVGLSLCLGIGFIFGICVAWHPFAGPWAEVRKWPTDEMVGRSTVRGMVVGVLIAIPSGAGVALSILGGNSGSLVGVAISASLLPPAVNAVMSLFKFNSSILKASSCNSLRIPIIPSRDCFGEWRRLLP